MGVRGCVFVMCRSSNIFWGVLAVELTLAYFKLAYLEFLFKTKP